MPTSTSLDSSALSFHHPIDAGLRRGAGMLGFGFVATALLLVVAVRPGLFGAVDALAWIATGAAFAFGAFLVATWVYGVERVVTIDTVAATLDEEIRTAWGFGTHFVRRCEECGPLSLMRDGDDREIGRAHV